MAIKRLYGESDDTYNKRKSMTGYNRYIKELFADLRKANEGTSLTEEAKDMLNCMDELQQLWDKALVGAVKNYQSNRVIKKSTNKDGGEKFDLRNNLGRQLQDWLNGSGKANGTYNGEYFELSTTPSVFVKHGAKSSQLIMYNDCVIKVTGGKHSLALDEISKLPEQLNDPILLFKGSVPNSFVALTDLVDKNGNDVIVAVHINKYHQRSVVNKIASMYSKTDNYGNNHIIDYINRQIREGNLIDVSTKKAPKWFTNRGLQLPKLVQTIIDANNRISQKPPVVNTQYTQNSKKDTSKFSIRRKTVNAYENLGEIERLEKRNQ